MTFGERLQAVRGPRKQLDIVRQGWPDERSAKKLADRANYLSRIERDEVPNVGLGILERIARGLGFDQLSAFFHAIENVASKDVKPALEKEPRTSPAQLTPQQFRTDNPPVTPFLQAIIAGGVPHGTLSATDTREICIAVATALFAAATHIHDEGRAASDAHPTLEKSQRHKPRRRR